MKVAGWLAGRWWFDVPVATVLLVATLPLMLVLAIAVRATSAGPALIRVARVGRGGTPFGMWKLRSMHGAPGTGVTRPHDPRVTRLGQSLRRSHLDEVPQLLNVVRGHMALIGPRPETPEYVDLADPRWTAVLAARPGIIGPTQLVIRAHEHHVLATAGVDGYRDHLLPVKLAVDGWYVRRASARLDASVVIGTVRELVLRRPASGLVRLVRHEVPEAALPSPVA